MKNGPALLPIGAALEMAGVFSGVESVYIGVLLVQSEKRIQYQISMQQKTTLILCDPWRQRIMKFFENRY